MLFNRLSLMLALTAVIGCSPDPAQDTSDATDVLATQTAAGSPETSAEATDPAADEAAVRTAALAFYAGYASGDFAEGLSEGKSELTPEFRAAWDRAVGAPDFALDFDPFCDCQDPYGLTGARVDSVALDGDTARVSLTLQWPDSSPTKQMIFKRVAGAWLLDDLSSGDWTSMHREMADAEPGSWGIG